MFKVQLINKEDFEDIVINRLFEDEISAEKYYNKIKNSMIADSNRIIREVNEQLHQTQLTYKDVILYLLDNEENELSKFYV